MKRIPAMPQDIIDHYTRTGSEDNRLNIGIGRLEYERTKEIIARYLCPGRTVIMDVGGGTGAYAFWLAEEGHDVHLLDLVPRHLAMARQKANQRSMRLASMQVGDARALPFADACADLVLLMGPLYHLTEREERLRALRESARVVRRGGRVLCAAISRFASMLDGFCSHLFDDAAYESIVDKDLLDGQHRNIVGDREYFTTAFFHKPAELREEIEAAALTCEKLLGVEGPLGLINQLHNWFAERSRYYELAIKYTKVVEEEESLLGASFHLLGIAQKP
jgi:ubiquinone/menaquinone biosynthesis C-methylase UbiE